MYLWLQGSIQRLKHAVPKGDKKRKKEVTLQIAKMEAELEDKHTQEQDQLRQVNMINSLTAGDIYMRRPRICLCVWRRICVAQKNFFFFFFLVAIAIISYNFQQKNI